MLLRVLLSTLALFTTIAAAQAERRVALVIGNSNYANAVRLPNPEGDAEAMASMLRGNGFETVVLGTNLGRDAMIEKIGQFAEVARIADTALFFYAGHGIQVDGKNYLVPVDAELKTELHAKNRTIDIDAVMHDAMSEAKRKLVLLDACRDNPFAKQIQSTLPKTRSTAVTSGLAEMRSGEGTLIAFATGPGQVALDGEGTHSPFTRALLAHLPTPGLEIRLALSNVRSQVLDDTKKQQSPWETTNMVGFFYMQPGSAPVTAAGPAASLPPQVGFDARQMEMEMWSSIKTSTNPAEYEAYLKSYPQGTFADLARTRIAAAKGGSQPGGAGNPGSGNVATGEIKTAEASQATEDALGLDRPKWADIQKRLTGLGFSTRGVDGSIGPNTRKGMQAWQGARGYPATGYLNRLQHDALLREVMPVSTSSSNDSDDTPKTRSYGRSGGSSNGGSGGGGGSSAGQAGEFVGGVARGLIGRGGGVRLPF